MQGRSNPHFVNVLSHMLHCFNAMTGYWRTIKSIVEALAHVSRRCKVSTCLMGDRRCVSIAKIRSNCGGKLMHTTDSS
jgi:hypothetical protein